MTIVLLLKAAAVVQLFIAMLNLNLVAILKWRDQVAALPLLLKQVFHVHLWFISITLAIFATLSWRFAGDIAGGQLEIARWLAGAIAAFWLVRVILQIAYYSPAHWRGKAAATSVHIALLAVYSGFVLVYGFCCLGG